MIASGESVVEIAPLTLPQDVESFHALLAEQQPQLSTRLKQVAKYVVDAPQQVAFGTLAEIAQQIGVTSSTLVRFANYFGFSGFSELQKLYKQQLLNHPSNYRERIRQLKQQDRAQSTANSLLHEFVEGGRLSLALLEQQLDTHKLQSALDLLSAAEDIYICGVRRVYPVASYLYYALTQLEIRCHLVNNQAELGLMQLKWVNTQSVLIAITFSPYSNFTQEVAHVAKEKGAKLVLITDSELSPLAALADSLLIVHESEIKSFRSLTATICLAQTLCVSLGYAK